MAETPTETVNRVYREFKRYTGDGLPNEPVGAPLPVGDPASNVWNPKKADLRQALLAPIDAAAQSASEAETNADRAEQAVADALEMIVPDDGVTEPKLSRSLSVRLGAPFDSVADMLASTIPAQGEGSIWFAEKYFYEEASASAEPFDPDTAPEGYHLANGVGVKLRVLRQAGNILQPEQWNATGDGEADDAALVQACVDFAESLPNSVVKFAPVSGYGIGTTIVFGAGANETIFEATAVRTASLRSYTFIKLSDIVAWTFADNNSGVGSQPEVRHISVKGRGDANNPAEWTPGLETKPGAVLYGRGRVISPAFEFCGGLVGSDGEANTTGYALGILQPEGGNCNYTRIEDAIFSRCAGDGIFVSKELAAILNVNAIRMSVQQYYECTGWAINNDRGYRNDMRVQHVAPASATMLGVFRINYVENTAWCQYCEAGTLVGVDFGASGNRNDVSFNDGTSIFATALFQNIRQNTVHDLQAAKTYIGESTAAGKQCAFIGRGGVSFGDEGVASSAYITIGQIGASGNGDCGIRIETDVSSSRTFQRFFNSNGQIGSIVGNGSATSYNTSSDASLKIDDGEITFEQARAILNLIVFRNFQWKVDGKTAHGVFAQELYEVYPDAVTRGGWLDPETEEWLDEDNGTEYHPWSVDYSKLVTVLGACLQGSLARQDDMEARLVKLEG